MAKIVKSTSAKSVLPVLCDTYNTFGNPETQKSDNGPPFNSKEMESFATKRDIELMKISPGHPAANNVETVMKPLGKAMKIGFNNKAWETETLHSFLQTYRDTPHPSTGAPPGAMLFRDGYRSNFPRKQLSKKQVAQAREADASNKNKRKMEYNASCRTKQSNFQIGDQVLVRNFHKQSKYEPYFLPERFCVTDTLERGKIILVQSTRTGHFLKRHPNDLKMYEGNISDTTNSNENQVSEEELLQAWREVFESFDNTEDTYYPEYTTVQRENNTPQNVDLHTEPTPARERVPNPKYFNENFVRK